MLNIKKISKVGGIIRKMIASWVREFLAKMKKFGVKMNKIGIP